MIRRSAIFSIRKGANLELVYFVPVARGYAVTPDETVGHIEQRTIDHSMCEGGTAQTYFRGAPVAKEMTMAQLGIGEYETLKMELTL